MTASANTSATFFMAPASVAEPRWQVEAANRRPAGFAATAAMAARGRSSLHDEALVFWSGLRGGLQQVPRDLTELAAGNSGPQSAHGRLQKPTQSKLTRVLNDARADVFV